MLKFSDFHQILHVQKGFCLQVLFIILLGPKEIQQIVLHQQC
jgi:hypothetical protein